MPDYIPIACIEHERLEFAVLRRQRLRLRWLDEEGPTEHGADILPLDVHTRDGAEWLVARDGAGIEFAVRLDRILASDPL